MILLDPTAVGNSISEATWSAARIATADNIDQRTWEDGVMYIFNPFTTRDRAHHALVRSSILNSAQDPA